VRPSSAQPLEVACKDERGLGPAVGPVAGAYEKEFFIDNLLVRNHFIIVD